MKIDVILGLQWGDEGKGKIVDVLTPHYDIIARFQGGPNAGHTIEFQGRKFILHTIPSGIFSPNSLNLIGSGVIVDPFILNKEIENLKAHSVEVSERLLISRRAHLILPTHRLLDAAQEAGRGSSKIGSTLKGIGPAYTDKISRFGLRIGDLKAPDFTARYLTARERHLRMARAEGFDHEQLLIDGIPFEEYERKWLEASHVIGSLNLCDSEYFLHERLEKGQKVLAEGAQGTMLDIDFGSYPYVTSSNTMAGGVLTGLGIPPHQVGKVIGIFKAYCTRVGSGPFPSELNNEEGEKMRQDGHEYGSTTGRPRRCGWLDLVALKYATMINGVNSLYMMKTDVLEGFSNIKVVTAYEMNGQQSGRVPFDLQGEPTGLVYRDFKGWNKSLAGLLNETGMPEELKSYIDFIQGELSVKMDGISYGPDREEILFL